MKKRIDRRDFIRTSIIATGGVVAGCQPPAGDSASGGESLQVSSGAPAAHRIEVPETTRAVQRVVASVRKKEGGGFMVRRPFPTRELDLVDPFLLLDEMGPVSYGPGEGIGAPDHPHRGFETVTYVLEGDLHHRDSMGHNGFVGPGGVQWMTAGSGIVHSEMPADRIMQEGGRVHGFQLWVNLPSDLKMMEPTYQEVGTGGLPQLDSTDGLFTGRIIAGEALGVSGQIQTTTPTTYQHWTLTPGAIFDLPIPDIQRVALMVFKGSVTVGLDETPLNEGDLAILGDGEVVRLASTMGATDNADLLLMAGAPIGEPVARYGPFVMNTEAELKQAFDDYQAGKMGRIPPG